MINLVAQRATLSKRKAKAVKPRVVVCNEPILQSNANRFRLFPLQYPDIWSMYKEAEATYWTTDVVDLSADLRDWEALNLQERHFLTNVLGYLSASDWIVVENLIHRFCNDLQISEARSFYAYQSMKTNIHSEMWSRLITNYVRDTDPQYMLFMRVGSFPCAREKEKWVKRWIDDRKASFAIKLMAFTVYQGVFFSGAFAAISWFHRRHLLPGLSHANILISQDHGLHTEFGCHVYSYLVERPHSALIVSMVTGAVEVEKRFIIDDVSVATIGLDPQLVSSYIEYVGDRLLVAIGLEEHYHSTNPFDFVDFRIKDKVDFFAKSVAELAKNISNCTPEELTRLSELFSVPEEI